MEFNLYKVFVRGGGWIGLLLKSNSFKTIIVSKAGGPLGLNWDLNLKSLYLNGSVRSSYRSSPNAGLSTTSSSSQNLYCSLNLRCKSSRSCLQSPGLSWLWVKQNFNLLNSKDLWSFVSLSSGWVSPWQITHNCYYLETVAGGLNRSSLYRTLGWKESLCFDFIYICVHWYDIRVPCLCALALGEQLDTEFKEDKEEFKEDMK